MDSTISPINASKNDDDYAKTSQKTNEIFQPDRGNDGTLDFPSKWNVYRNSSSDNPFIAEHQNQPIASITRTDENRWKDRRVSLYAGPSTSQPLMASGRYLDDSSKKWEIDLQHLTNEQSSMKEIITQKRDWKRVVFQFSIATNVANQKESFEWRSTNNPRIKTILNGQSLGWKLVHMTAKPPSNEESTPGTLQTSWPKTSDGYHVVAICAKNGGVVLHKLWRFAFLGTGKDGALGATWERVAVITALMLMDFQYKRDFDMARGVGGN
ncbi:hypothetical protein G7054_g11498 [Neopestalotiopsis clavispora]|nr:hypothetical protein G7054_g11498 [Neopestalotiopsis clavispora]